MFINGREELLEQFDKDIFNALVENIEIFANAFCFCVEEWDGNKEKIVNFRRN